MACHNLHLHARTHLCSVALPLHKVKTLRCARSRLALQRRALFGLIAFLCLVYSWRHAGYLLWSKLTDSQVACPVGGCSSILNSPYAKLGPMPLPALGMLGYGTVAAASAAGARQKQQLVTNVEDAGVQWSERAVLLGALYSLLHSSQGTFSFGACSMLWSEQLLFPKLGSERIVLVGGVITLDLVGVVSAGILLHDVMGLPQCRDVCFGRHQLGSGIHFEDAISRRVLHILRRFHPGLADSVLHCLPLQP